jgi:hypothetical protein
VAPKEPNLNNPRRQPGESDYSHFPALKELNIIIREITFHLAEKLLLNPNDIKPFQGFRSGGYQYPRLAPGVIHI